MSLCFSSEDMRIGMDLDLYIYIHSYLVFIYLICLTYLILFIHNIMIYYDRLCILYPMSPANIGISRAKWRYFHCLAPKHQGWLRMDQLIVSLVHPKGLIGRKFGTWKSLEIKVSLVYHRPKPEPPVKLTGV
jgi:hypothetical protein